MSQAAIRHRATLELFNVNRMKRMACACPAGFYDSSRAARTIPSVSIPIAVIEPSLSMFDRGGMDPAQDSNDNQLRPQGYLALPNLVFLRKPEWGLSRGLVIE